MQKIIISTFYLLIILVVLSCGHKKTPTPPLDPASLILSTDSTQFYDVQSFLEGEIKDVATTPYFIYSITTVDGKRKDSLPITSTAFGKLAQVFLANNINDTSIKKFYKENVFRDLTTKSITMSYSTLNKDLHIQGLEVLLDEETNRVKYILIRTINNSGDSTEMTQLNWKKGESFFINTTVINKNGESSSKQQFVCWNE